MKAYLKPPHGAGAFLSALLPVLASAAPYVPTGDSEVLYQLPAGAVSVRQQASATRDPSVAAVLARGWIERARSEGDPRFLGYAQGVLGPWWGKATAPAGIPLLRATVLQSQHRFADALAELERILAVDPMNAQALLTQATVLRVQGRYSRARAACEALAANHPGVEARICVTSIDSLNGSLPAALVAIEKIEPMVAVSPPGIQSWYLSERADMLLRAGNANAALQLYQRALQARPDDVSLKVRIADLLQETAGPRAVLEFLDGEPKNDGLLLRLAIAARGVGAPRPDIERRLAETHALARRRGDVPHLREEAMLALSVHGDTVGALALAQENWKSQREPVDALLLARAAAKLGNPGAAAALVGWLHETAMQDVRLDAALAGLNP